MNGSPAPMSSTPGGLFGILRSWLQAWPIEARWVRDDLPIGTGWPDAQARGSARVLVVDDNPVNLMVISALLESRGLVPWLAEDGAEAVALACELSFDLILMDLQMPILDGLDATSAIRRYETSFSRSAVPIVAHSSHAPDAGVLAMHGMNGSLRKPCGAQDLEDCLLQWCPTYRPAPTVRGLAHARSDGQVARRIPGSIGALLR